MSNTIRLTTTQAATSSAVAKTITVVDFRTREEFLTALRATALQAKYTPTDILVAVTLAQAFHCKNKTCAPEDGYKGIARQIGAGERTVKESARKLEAHGFVIRHPGGRYETIKFTLTIPSSMSAGMSALMEHAKTAPMSAKNGVHECKLSASHISTEVVQRDSAAPPRAVSPADRPVAAELVARESAPDGALDYLMHQARRTYALSQREAEPLRTVINNALHHMPRDFVMTHIAASPSCQDFLTSIAEVTATSS